MYNSYTITNYDNLPEATGILVLIHAMYTDGSYFEKPKGKSLVEYFKNEGFIVKRLDLSGYTVPDRNHKPDSNINFETYVTDVELAIKELKIKYPKKPIYLLAHSVGGLAAMVGGGLSKVDAIVSIAPAIWTFTQPENKVLMFKQFVKLTIPKTLSLMFGEVPSKLMKIGDRNAPVGYLSEYFYWVKNRVFRSPTLDYTTIIIESKVPTLLIRGSKDFGMCPKFNFDWITKNLATNSTIWTITKKEGFDFEGDHFSVIYGKDAAREVWPKISLWLKELRIYHE